MLDCRVYVQRCCGFKVHGFIQVLVGLGFFQGFSQRSRRQFWKDTACYTCHPHRPHRDAAVGRFLQRLRDVGGPVLRIESPKTSKRLLYGLYMFCAVTY